MNGYPRETIKEAGYRYGGFSPEFGLHMMIDAESGARSWWIARKGFAGYALIYKNTHLEFVSGGAVNANGKPVEVQS